ncbi:MAG: hypothetical protein M1821_008738 [Bathelium mastoideum]|nr:MAG: hypothetical protein M1821_008738 [Bathelium mastoideum]
MKGAATARALACLIDRIGIPDRDAISQMGLDPMKEFHDIYRKFQRGQLRQARVSQKMKQRFQSHRGVRIAALCCFDTVSAIGFPQTGLYRVIKPVADLITNRRYLDLDPNSCVDCFFHAIAIHETRAPYRIEPMYVREDSPEKVIKQVYFIGSHADMGREPEYGGLVNIPLAWMLQQLSDHVGFKFDEGALEHRFPGMNETATNLLHEEESEIIHDSVRKRRRLLQTLAGTKARVPGTYARDKMVTAEEIHCTVRLRGYGITRQDLPVPGFDLEQHNGTSCWVRRAGRHSTSSSTGALRIDEAPLGTLEARLLGIHQ